LQGRSLDPTPREGTRPTGYAQKSNPLQGRSLDPTPREGTRPTGHAQKSNPLQARSSPDRANFQTGSEAYCGMSASTEISNVRLTSETKPLKLSLVFLALLAYKIIYLLAISSAISIWPEDAHAHMFHSANQVSTPDGHLTFDCHFASWDAEHYLFIAAHGYEAGSSRCAFYPLFPLMVRYCSIITGISRLVTGIMFKLFSK
jgi:hypothetical protein